MLVRAQAAGIGARVPPVAVGVLAFFSQPRRPEEAQGAFGPQIAAIVKGLMDVGLVVPEQEAEQTPVFFDNFSGLDVHRRMLADRVRVDAYRAALDAVVQPGQRVLDAGTGSGLLAILAARAGAGAVEAVDNSAMVERAAEVVAASGLSEVVTCHRADFASVEVEPVDVVVTETFGALCLAEGAAEDLIRCCERNLAEGGVVIPSAVSLVFAPITDPAGLAPVFEPFRVEGVDFGVLEQAQRSRAVTRVVDPAHLGHAPVVLARVGFPHEAVRVAGTVRFEGLTGPVHGLCGWFDLHLAPGVELPTGPMDPQTHWQQVVLPLELEPVDGVVELELLVEPAPEDRRGLVVTGRWAGGERVWRVR